MTFHCALCWAGPGGIAMVDIPGLIRWTPLCEHCLREQLEAARRRDEDGRAFDGQNNDEYEHWQTCFRCINKERRDRRCKS